MADLVLLYSGGKTPETGGESPRHRAWDGLFHEIGGAPQTAATRSPRQRRRSAPTARSATRAPLHTGQTIVQADSLDASTTIVKGSPALQGGGSIITVYETFEVLSKVAGRGEIPSRTSCAIRVGNQPTALVPWMVRSAVSEPTGTNR